MSLDDRAKKVAVELSVLGAKYAERQPNPHLLVREVQDMGIKAMLPGTGVAPDTIRHLAAMAIGILAILEPEVEEQPVD